MPFEFHPRAAEALNDGGRALLAKIAPLNLTERPAPAFRSERPISATITRADIVEDPVVWASSADGQPVLAFIFQGDQVFGLDEEAYKDVRRLSDQIFKAKWARSSLGDKFVEQAIIRWCRASFGSDNAEGLASNISSAAESSIQPRTMWAPIAGLEVESAFSFGFTTISPIAQSMIDELESGAKQGSPNQAEQIGQLFVDLRKEMQGLGAVTFEIEAEPSYIDEKGLLVANDAVGLLRFFSAPSFDPLLSSIISPLGSEYLPKSNVLVLGPEGSFSWTTGIINKNVFHWSISDQEVKHLIERGLELAGALLDETSLNSFQSKVRSSIITFTKGSLLPEINDRLVYTLSSLESLFLRNASEPIQQNLGERMAFIVSKNGNDRRKIVRNVRDIYGMRSQYVHHRVSAIEEDELRKFILTARRALFIALQQTVNFESVEDFHDAIDELKFGSGDEASGE